MASQPSPTTWAAALLKRLGIHQTPGAIRALVGWQQAEGGHWHNDAKFNPLNTTQKMPGSSSFRSVGVGAADIGIYKNWQQGLDATVKTLRNGRYGGILSALQRGDPNAVAGAIGNSPWGTKGSSVASRIAATPTVRGAQPFTGSGAPAGSLGAGGFGAASAGTVVGGTPATSPTQEPGGIEAAVALLTAAGQQKPTIQSSGLATPAFAAGAQGPQGYTPVPTGGGPVSSKPSIDTLLKLVAATPGTGETVGTPGTPGTVVPGTTGATGATSGAGNLPKGTAKFEGEPVAAWIAPALKYARAHGWKGSVNSGYRTYAEQAHIYASGVRPAAKPGTSNHEGADFPRGAIDVSDAAGLSKILRNSPYGARLVWAGPKDPVHFSHPHGGSY